MGLVEYLCAPADVFDKGLEMEQGPLDSAERSLLHDAERLLDGSPLGLRK